MKIAIIGSGGREHALAWKIEQSPLSEKVFVLPGNGGTKNNIEVDISDFSQIKDICLENKIDLIIIGPEIPLSNGIVDYFKGSEIMIFGPDKNAAQLESSKIFAKRFMKKYHIATPDFKEFSDISSAIKYSKKINGNCVIKYDGLAAGKGVYVCSSIQEADNSLTKLAEKYGKGVSLIIEEKLSGSELSILAFTDGENYKLLLPSQDHKQLLENDKGPNTGGMGAFCPVPFYDKNLEKQTIENIIEPTMIGIKSENFHYKGVIYFGLMITDDGPKLLEYNVRLGDPETEVVLPALKSDLLELIISCINGNLKEYYPEFYEGFFVDVVLVSGGYPDAYKKNIEICGLDDCNDELIFHAGTKKENRKFFTNGGRVLNVVAHRNLLEDAVKNAYEKVNLFYFDNMFYRKDIGKREN